MKRIGFVTGLVLMAVFLMKVEALPSHEWKVNLRVVDAQEQPVQGATVSVGYRLISKERVGLTSMKKEGLTDSNGVFVASGREESPVLYCQAQKSGYYSFGIEHELGLPSEYEAARWNPSLTLILKKVDQPIPMFAKWVKSNPPVTNGIVGFDLMAGDWVSPYGKGATADILFAREYIKRGQGDYTHKITVSFPNAGDGIQEFDVPFALGQGSALRSPHKAPENGFKAQLVRENSASPGKPGKFDFDERRNYFFRVRTALGENGQVKSALYGKIYGDFMRFRYYLNPEPNSRNVEFDPKQNLMRDLKSTDQVDVP